MRRRVGFVIFPRAKLLDVTGALQVFNDACGPDGDREYETVLASLEGGRVPTDCPVSLDSIPIRDLMAGGIDTLLVAGGTGTREAVMDRALLKAIGQAQEPARRVGSICSGTFLLAAAGLLSGRRVTTHWDSCNRLARHFPDLTVEADAIYVNDGRVWTSAGVTSGIDMALAMVAQDLGRAEAVRLARQLVTFMWRPGGQSQFSMPLRQQTRDAEGRFDGLHDWIRDNLEKDLRVEALADRMNMSLRSFNRLYREETGKTPAKAVEIYRLEAARQMLSESGLSILQIADICGFGDDERMRRAFIRSLGVSPRDYRQRFRALAS